MFPHDKNSIDESQEPSDFGSLADNRRPPTSVEHLEYGIMGQPRRRHSIHLSEPFGVESSGNEFM